MKIELFQLLMLYLKMLIIGMGMSFVLLKGIPLALGTYKKGRMVKCWIYGALVLFASLLLLRAALA